LVITSGIVKLSWEEKARRAKEHREKAKTATAVMIDLATQKPEIDDWIAKNRAKIENLLKPIVVSLFNAEKAVKE
jgi:hypothetical protein